MINLPAIVLVLLLLWLVRNVHGRTRIIFLGIVGAGLLFVLGGLEDDVPGGKARVRREGGQGKGHQVISPSPSTNYLPKCNIMFCKHAGFAEA